MEKENQRYLSVASLWEMSIKASYGRLEIMRPISALIQEHVSGNDIAVLPIRDAHLEGLFELPLHHKDPFDRVMIAQARAERLTFVSCDRYVTDYDVDVLW